MNRNAWKTVAAILMIATCNRADAQEVASGGVPDAKPAVVHRDLEFARVGGKRLLLDLHLPQGVDNPPLIVWVHGGAWRKGSKSFGRVAWMTRHGYAIAGISYRLSQEAIFPAQIHDCKAAIRWLRAHAKEYGYDASRMGVAGSSAGGHLAALLGTSAEVDSVEGTLGDHLKVSSAVQAVCDMWGPTDFLRMGGGHNRPTSPESLLVGGPIQEHKDRCALANPITYIDRSDPPFLLIHGDQDGAVRLNQSELLQTALEAAGVTSELKVLKGAAHGGRGYPVEKMNKMVLNFFEAQFKPASSSSRGDEVTSLVNGKTLDGSESDDFSIFTGEPRLLIVNGYSTSKHWWAFLQRKIDRRIGGPEKRVVEVQLCNKGGTPIADWMNVETGERSAAWKHMLTPMIQAEKGKRPVVLLCQQSLQGVYRNASRSDGGSNREGRAAGIRNSDDRERIERGADVIQQYARNILDDGAAGVVIAMHIYKPSAPPRKSGRRQAD